MFYVDYALITSGISFLGAFTILFRKVHENRVAGVMGEHVHDSFWPFSLFLEYTKKFFVYSYKFLMSLISPYIKKFVCFSASGLHKMTYSASNKFLQISNFVQGKGTLKRDTHNASSFIKGISDYKRDIHEK